MDENLIRRIAQAIADSHRQQSYSIGMARPEHSRWENNDGMGWSDHGMRLVRDLPLAGNMTYNGVQIGVDQRTGEPIMMPGIREANEQNAVRLRGSQYSRNGARLLHDRRAAASSASDRLAQALAMMMQGAISGGGKRTGFPDRGRANGGQGGLGGLIDQMQGAFPENSGSFNGIVDTVQGALPGTQRNVKTQQRPTNTRPPQQSAGSAAREDRMNSRTRTRSEQETVTGLPRTGGGPQSYDPNRRGPK